MGGINWEVGTEINTLLCMKQGTNENLLYRTGTSVLCGDLNGKEIQKRGDTYLNIADSLCCTAETNATL